jgi:Rrf2 family protein
MKLELTRRGDYAIRAALAVADAAPASVSGQRIVATTEIPQTFLGQVMGDLVRTRIVTGRPGPGGGYRLAADPMEVSLLSIVEAVEGPSRRTTCVLRGGACRVADRCRVHDAFFAAQERMLASLAGVTLADLAIHPGNELAAPERTEAARSPGARA